MSRKKESHIYSISITSTSWVYQDLGINANSKTQELPSEITVDNNSSYDIHAKLMDSTEGDATSRTGFFVAKNQSKTMYIEDDELPFCRMALRLDTGSASITINASGDKYILSRL